jgi:hypothetical protein
MRSEKISVHRPLALKEAFEKRAKDLGYPSVGAWFISLGLYDCSIGKPHYATGQIHELSLAEQDKIHEEISRAYLAGETLGGSWFENRLEEAVKKENLPASPPATRVGQRIQRMISRRQGAAE